MQTTLDCLPCCFHQTPDGAECGLDRYCTVITNGTGCPGTPLDLCSRIFRERFFSAEPIISKGRGNFETLAWTPGPIYYLLTVKCGVVAEHIDRQVCRWAAGSVQRLRLAGVAEKQNSVG